jgi:hypothetical protein
MRTPVRRLVGTVVLTAVVAVAAAGCIAVPVGGPDYAYVPPAPVVVVPAPVYRSYHHGYYRGGYHRGWRHR